MNDPKSAAPGIPQIYASHVQISASVSEISILLGVNGVPEMGGSGVKPAEPVGVVRLSPQAAKVLHISLAQVLKAYEQKFAKLDLGADTERALATAAAAAEASAMLMKQKGR